MGSVRDESSVALRQQLTNLRALLVLSILMMESAEEEQILRLAESSAASLGRWRIAGFVFENDRWWPDAEPAGHPPAEGRRNGRAGGGSSTGPEAGPAGGNGSGVSASRRYGLERNGIGGAAFRTNRRHGPPIGLIDQVRRLGDAGGPVTVAGHPWGWAYPLFSIAGLLGYLIAYADEPLAQSEQFLVQVVAQHTGVAVSNARLHQRERDSAAELAATNAALQRGMQIHERLTRVAAAGEGSAGIAAALHELTGFPVAIEDRYGNLRAWAGPGRPDPYPKQPERRREHLLHRLRSEGRSVREDGRVAAFASPRPDVLGVVALIDPDGRADSADIVALEHGATVLAVELARLRGLADAELRVRRDLMHDLLTGIDDDDAYARAEALGYDLFTPHRVVVAEGPERSRGEEAFLHAVRRALRERRLNALLGTRSGVVVILVGGDTDWEALRQAIMSELGVDHCRLGVGGLYPRPSQLPGSLREAELALRLQKASSPVEQTTEFAGLGVLRMLASMPDLVDVEDFARTWLGPLIEYDDAKNASMVATLTQYLQHGGVYQTTAKVLCIHRSTLKYRLQRIRDLTGLDLSDPEVHFNLQLATKAWATLQALRN